MHNAIDIGIRRIEQFIPNSILQSALANSEYVNFGLRNAIQDDIITDVVMSDCNLGGGKTLHIPLLLEYHEPLSDELYGVYRIPIEVTGGREIVEVHRLLHNPRNHKSFYSHSGGLNPFTMGMNSDPYCMYKQAVPMAMHDMVASKTGIGDHIDTPSVELLQGGLIRLHPGPRTHIDWLLTCRVAYDSNMTNLNSEGIDKFADVCLVAAKIFCYNKLIIKLDIGAIQLGSEIGSIKDIISDWSDLGEEYREKVNYFHKANSLDLQRIGSLIQYMV